MIRINARGTGYRYALGSAQPVARLGLLPVSPSSKIAERLLAHARLCRQIAGDSWDETAAEKLNQFANECVRAAELARQDEDCPGLAG